MELTLSGGGIAPGQVPQVNLAFADVAFPDAPTGCSGKPAGLSSEMRIRQTPCSLAKSGERYICRYLKETERRADDGLELFSFQCVFAEN